jgi:predicted signal transduction protein with EAL and GGDEF domain
MKWAGAYFLGYFLLIAGIVAALAKAGVLSGVSPAWIAIGVVILLGLGVMVSVANSGRKESISIEK